MMEDKQNSQQEAAIRQRGARGSGSLPLLVFQKSLSGDFADRLAKRQ